MAALVFGEHVRRHSFADRVEIASAGTGPLIEGAPLHPDAAMLLAERGYPTEHHAARVGPAELEADLLVALAGGHRCVLHQLVADPEQRIRLLRSFDPAAGDDLDVPDPMLGGPDAYLRTLDLIEAAVPGLLAWTTQRLAATAAGPA
jgi:protein-tyrosine phosphatase